MSSIKQIAPLSFPWQTLDPFIFCVHHRDLFPEGNGKMGVKPELKAGRQIGSDFTIKNGWRMYHGEQIPGFPYHPHRGFETVTINKEGFVDHTDSLGAAGRFGQGDVQWMTAGKGVQHSEMFPLIHADKSNTMEIFQIWLNLPAKNKLVEPHFKMLWSEDVPVHTHTDEQGRKTIIDVVAGMVDETKALDPTPNSWAADPENEVAILTIKMEVGASWTMEKASKKVNRCVYFYRGQNINVDGQKLALDHMAVLDATQDSHFENGNLEGYLLILQGKPINEPIAQHGPFVMNTREEIMQAFQEFQETQFGGWPWPEREMVHPTDKGRFAKYADGTEETR